MGQCDIEACKPLPPSRAVAARELALTCIESVAPELQPNCWNWHRFALTAISFHAACRAGRTRGSLERNFFWPAFGPTARHLSL